MGIEPLEQGKVHIDLAHYEAGLLAIRQRDFAAARARLADSFNGLGRHQAALAQCEAISKGMEGKTAPASFEAMLLGVHGRALLGLGRVEHAVDLLEPAVALYRELEGRSWERAGVLWALARALRASGRGTDQRSRALAEEARAIYAARGDAGAFEHAAISDWLAAPMAPRALGAPCWSC